MPSREASRRSGESGRRPHPVDRMVHDPRDSAPSVYNPIRSSSQKYGTRPIIERRGGRASPVYSRARVPPGKSDTVSRTITAAFLVILMAAAAPSARKEYAPAQVSPVVAPKFDPSADPVKDVE